MKQRASRKKPKNNFPGSVRIAALWFAAAIVLALGAGCMFRGGWGFTEPVPTAVVYGVYDVSSLFQEFYDYSGGENSLGPAISPELIDGTVRVQWVTAAQIVFDPLAPMKRRYTLAPVGRQLGVEEPPVPPPTRSDLHYVNGHVIHPDFWPLYEKMGAKFVGAPLTEARYNSSRHRLEQYFENLGFYRLEGTSDVHLLGYGVWACGDICRQYVDDMNVRQDAVNFTNAQVDVYGDVDPVFQGYVGWLGRDLTGPTLGKAYSQGVKHYQVFENIVLALDDLQDPTSVHLLPVPELTHSYYADDLQPSSGNEEMYFVAIEGELGYDVPWVFWNFILEHGGPDVSGPPVTSYAASDARTLKQCFSNYCLLYVQDEIESMQVSVDALGYAYQFLFPAPDTINQKAFTGKVNAITPWASSNAVAFNQRQEVGAYLTADYQPVSGVQSETVVVLTDGNRLTYTMPPSDSQGRTSIYLDPIPGQSGDIILFYICIAASETEQFCAGDDFVIWNE